MSLPTPASVAIGRYLQAIDAELPGFAEAVYVVGSLALDDWQSPESDIDLVVVSSARAEEPGLEALARVHADRTRPRVDCVYLTWDDLAGAPASAPPGPFVIDGRFYAVGHGPRVPVTWHTLAHHGFAVRGKAPHEFPIFDDPDVLAQWTKDNLVRYWSPRLDRTSRLYGRLVLLSFSDWETTWAVLGVARLHYTLATGQVTSKTGAGRYALETFDARWRRIIEEALRIRAGESKLLYRNPFARRRDMLAFARMAIADALA